MLISHECVTASCSFPSNGRAVNDTAPVCVGFDSKCGYYWNCQQCSLRYPGFQDYDSALRMANAHCALRYSDHRVGQAIKRKRQAGMPETLSYAELTIALHGE